jgi:N-acetylmuramoyl-L-alanine amidase
MAKICIDPGKSGFPDPSAVGPKGLLEADVTFIAATLLISLAQVGFLPHLNLRRCYPGA